MTGITIRDASPGEAAELSAIAYKAKGYWGYPPEQMEAWREKFLTITPAYITANRVWVAVINEQAAGFAAVKESGRETILDDLWVLPAYIGQGIGRRLFLHVAAIIPEFVFTSDPHADGFYLKMGAHKIGECESDIQGRTLTKFRYRSTV